MQSESVQWRPAGGGADADAASVGIALPPGNAITEGEKRVDNGAFLAPAAAVEPNNRRRAADPAAAVRRRLLSCPGDASVLSEHVCIARAQIEVFTATAENVAERLSNGGVRDSIDVGRVGIRCVHCARAAAASAAAVAAASEEASGGGGTATAKAARLGRGAVSYPKARRLVYQSVRNWQRNHLLKCPHMPTDVKARCAELKARTQQRSSTDCSSYWHGCLARMGAIDTDRGVRLRRGVFEDDDDGGEEFEEEVNEQVGDRGDDIIEPSFDCGQKQVLPDFAASVIMAASTATATTAEVAGTLKVRACQTQLLSSGPISTEPKTPAAQSSANAQGTNVSPAGADNIDAEVASFDAAVHKENANLDHSAARGSQSAPSMHSLVPPRKEVIQQIELACDAVQATMVIQQLPDTGNCSSNSDADRRQELLFLGMELYELFAGRRPFEEGDVLGKLSPSAQTFNASPAISSSNDAVSQDPTANSSERTVHIVQQCKKKKQRDNEGRKEFVPLSELGLPIPLCNLVSSLLDATDTASKDGDVYNSVNEVHQDLCLMVSQPDRFLFDGAAGANLVKIGQLVFSHDTLYGRDGHVSKLLEAYHQMRRSSLGTAPADGANNNNNNNVVLVSGYSGTGKSTLVRKARSQFVDDDAGATAIFVSGKFDAMCQMKPLSAVMSALNEYCRLVARRSAEEEQGEGLTSRMREAVSAALGEEEGRVLAALIPNLTEILPEAVCGHRRSSPVCGSAMMPEVQYRLAFLVRTLLRSTCVKERPLVLFLDDMQWADASSLELIRSLVTDPTLDSLLFIGSYRDNEVKVGHPLVGCLEGIRRSGTARITQIFTGNLDRTSVNALVSDALHMLPRATRSLSEAVLQKTSGNALFVEQFLASLNDESLLRYSLATRKWEWDIEIIRTKNIANNVVDLMTAKLLRLAPEVHEALKVAAAFGSQCLKDVLRIFDKDPGRMGSTVAALDVAVAAGVMVEVEGPAYRFSHDQLQNAAFMLIAESERHWFHLQIGRSLWQQSTVDEIDSYLFILVDQLHRGAGLISDGNEKIRLAQLSLKAGQKATAMTAFLPAFVYLKAGIGLLQETDWEWHRELCFDLHNSCAEMAYILGKFDDVKLHLLEVTRRGKTLREKLQAYYTSVRSSGSQQNTASVFATSIMVLDHLGESIPSEVTQLEVQQELIKTQMLLSTKSEEELHSLEIMTDVDKQQAMRFFDLLTIYAYLEKEQYFPLIACKMMQLSLSHGVCKESAFAFAAYGFMLCGLFGDMAGGHRFGKIAQSLVQRFKAKDCLARVMASCYGFINDWTEPLQSSLPPLKQAVNAALSTGSNEIAMGTAHIYLEASLASGKALGALARETDSYAKQMFELSPNFYTRNKPLRQFVLNLLGKSVDPTKLVGGVMDESDFLSLAEMGPDLSSVVRFYRFWLEVLFGEYERAVETAAKNKDFETRNMGRFVMLSNHAFYYGLCALVLARKQGRGKWEDAINETMDKMRKWASSNPWNCQHKLELMNAEYAYLEGDFVAATKAFDCAVASAKKHRFVHDEALALERAGIFYLENGDHATASKSFERARQCYLEWEAPSKAAQVERYI